MRRRLLFGVGLAALLSLGGAATGCNLTRVGLSAMGRQAERKGFEARVLEVGPHRIRYWVGGEGPPLLMLHGFGGDGLSNWRPQLDALSEVRTLIIPDLLWFGESDSDAAPSVEVQAEAQLALLDHLGYAEVDVINVSYGGFVTLALLHRDPERLGQVIFQDTPGPFFSDAQHAAFLERFGVERAAEIFAAEEPEDVAVLFELLYYDEPWVPRWMYRDIHDAMFGDHHAEKIALLEELEARRAGGWEAEVTALLGQMEPTLVVWGRHDPVFPVAAGEQLAAATGGRLVVIEEADHGPSVERPDAFNAAALEYLTGAGGQ